MIRMWIGRTHLPNEKKYQGLPIEDHDFRPSNTFASPRILSYQIPKPHPKYLVNSS